MSQLDSALLIYRTTRDDASEELERALKQFEHAHGTVEEEHVGAWVGDVAGTALNLLLMPEVQALANLIQIGTPLWCVVRAALKSGRKIFMQKAAAPALAAARVKEDIAKQPPDEAINWGNAKVWGPMEAEPLVGFSGEWFANDGASIPRAYLTAIAVPWHRNRVRTYWYVISDGGELCSAWWTQTLREQVPDFLRPGAV